MGADLSQIAKGEMKNDSARGSTGWLGPRPYWTIAFVVIVAALFGKPLLDLATYVMESDLDSYILLIPFITIYLIWTRKDKVVSSYLPDWLLGLPLLVLGLGVFLSSGFWTSLTGNLSHNDYLTLTTFAFVCFVAAGGFLLMGRSWMASVAFPFAFLAFMIPLPDFAVDYLETGSKLASAEAASWFFALTGTPVLRDGNIFQLPGISIEVARECSGIRSSWILIITSLLAAHLFLRSTGRQLALVAFVIPLGILRNGFRILVISLLCIHIGPEMIHSAIHKRGGPLFFALSLVPLFILLWLLRRGDWKAKRTREVRNPRTI